MLPASKTTPMLCPKLVSSTLLLISSPSRITHLTKATALCPLMRGSLLAKARVTKGTRAEELTSEIRRLRPNSPKRVKKDSHPEMSTSRIKIPRPRVPRSLPLTRAPAARVSVRDKLPVVPFTKVADKEPRAPLRPCLKLPTITTATNITSSNSSSTTPCSRSPLRPLTSRSSSVVV
jgi:hypothetical protein